MKAIFPQITANQKKLVIENLALAFGSWLSAVSKIRTKMVPSEKLVINRTGGAEKSSEIRIQIQPVSMRSCRLEKPKFSAKSSLGNPPNSTSQKVTLFSELVQRGQVAVICLRNTSSILVLVCRLVRLTDPPMISRTQCL
jgi:hypothetical protein